MQADDALVFSQALGPPLTKARAEVYLSGILSIVCNEPEAADHRYSLSRVPLLYLNGSNCMPLLDVAHAAQSCISCRQIIRFKLLSLELQGDRVEAALCHVDRVRDLSQLDRLRVNAPEVFPVCRK